MLAESLTQQKEIIILNEIKGISGDFPHHKTGKVSVETPFRIQSDN